MKKAIVTLVFVLAVSFSYGQQKPAEKRAIANTKEMVKVLSLDADQDAAIYKINLDKSKKLIANKANQDQSKEEMKANQKAIFVESNGKFKEVIGLDKMKKWWAYKNAQAVAKKNKN